MMGFGLVAISFCLIYLFVWSYNAPSEPTHTAMIAEDQFVTKKKRSKWD